MPRTLMLLALAGAFGTLARFGLSGLIQRNTGFSFPTGTLAVNVCGCFIAGLFWSLAENRLAVSGQARTIFLIGFLGAFTTFSAYMLETSQLARDSEWLRAVCNVVFNNVIGALALFLGLFAGRII